MPPWEEFERLVKEGLSVEETESPDFKASIVNLTLPEVLWFDYDDAAKSVDWSLGQFLAFLILRGALSLMPEQEEGLTLDAQVDVRKFWKRDSQ